MLFYKTGTPAGMQQVQIQFLEHCMVSQALDEAGKIPWVPVGVTQNPETSKWIKGTMHLGYVSQELWKQMIIFVLFGQTSLLDC